MKCGLLPLTQQANEIMPNVAYHEYDIAVGDDDECERIGRDLHDKHIMIMHNHGLLTCASTMPEAFYLLYTLENACKVQVDALASGQELLEPKQKALKLFADYGRVRTHSPSRSSQLAWPALMRMLDSQDQSYKQ